jgi:hypothetical protein
MERIRLLGLVATPAIGLFLTGLVASGADDRASPVFGVTVPPGYRLWGLVAVSHEAGLDELRGIVGNPIAMKAFRAGTLPFPDGAIIAKIGWKHVPLPHAPFAGAYAPGQPTTVQVMVKDSKKFAATGGWGYGRFIDGVPTSEAEHRTCAPCHQTYAKDHDFLFTHYAP